jgi:hypothetical protein
MTVLVSECTLHFKRINLPKTKMFKSSEMHFTLLQDGHFLTSKTGETSSSHHVKVKVSLRMP